MQNTWFEEFSVFQNPAAIAGDRRTASAASKLCKIFMDKGLIREVSLIATKL
jgi:hypothetical protein